MQTLNNLTLISGGNASTLPLTLGEQSMTYFDRPIIGYTQTFLYRQYDGMDMSNHSESVYYTNVYEITPIYAPL